MDTNEYKAKKLDKLTRDLLQAVNKLPSFGFGDDIDNSAKIALSNYFVTLARIVDNGNVDVEILTQSMSDEVASITSILIHKFSRYKFDLEENA